MFTHTCIKFDDGVEYLDCDHLAVINCDKSTKHTGRLLAHEIKKWMRNQPHGCRIFICISYNREYQDERFGNWIGNVDSALCDKREYLYLHIDDFAQEWVKYLRLFPEDNKEAGDNTVLHFCICNCTE